MWNLYIDGGARGNPGESGIGIVLSGETENKGFYYYTGRSTNNEAEYSALIKGLEICAEENISEVQVFSDSQLVCHQINGLYKVKNERLIKLFNNVMLLKNKFNFFSIKHIPREKNKEADKLVNMAIDLKKNGEIKLAVAPHLINN